MLTLHHLSQSRSFRILWLLEELSAEYGLDYTLMTHQRQPNFLAPDALLAIHPMGKAPILVDDSLPVGEQALAESALIIEYLLKFYDKNQKFMPDDDFSSWRDYQFWLHFAEGSLMPPLVMGLILTKSVQKSPVLVRPIVRKVKDGVDKMILTGNVDKSLRLLDDFLQNKNWLVNDKLTGADIQLYFSVFAAKSSGVNVACFANVHRWLQHCESRSAFKNAIAKSNQG